MPRSARSHPLARTALVFVLVAGPCPAVADGDLDSTFSGDGAVLWAAVSPLHLAALAPGADRLFAVGHHGLGTQHLQWWSVGVDGSPDLARSCETTTADALPFSLGVSSRLTAAVVDAAGRLVVGGAMTVFGSESQERAFVARFDVASTGCVADTSFVANGWILLDDSAACLSNDCEVLDLVELHPTTGVVSESHYVALVRESTGGLGASALHLVRLTEDGDLDPEFSADGWAEVVHPSFGDHLFPQAALAADPRGRLYVLVTHSDPGLALDLDVSLVRYTDWGARDGGFEDGGRLGISGIEGVDAVDARARDLVVQPDGALYAAIAPSGWGSIESGVWGRRAGEASTAVADLGAGGPALVVGQSDGRVVVVRDTDAIQADSTRVSRFDPAAPSSKHWANLDSTWGTAGNRDVDVDFGGGNADTPTAVALWQGRLVIGGTADTINFTGAYLVRFTSALIFADGFEGGTPAAWSSAVAVSP